MRNLLIVLALVFTFLTSCQKDNDFVPANDPQEEVQDPVINDDEQDNDDNDNQEEEENNEEDEQDNEQEDDEEEEDDALDFCFVETATLIGNGFEHQIIFERTALGRLEEIIVLKDGVVTKKADINYRTNGKLRAMAITQNGRQDLVSFTTDGEPVDMSSTFSDGTKKETKYGLDSKGRIIKKIVRKDGKTTSELNYIFEGENIVAQEGFALTSSGHEIPLDRNYTYDEEGLNPMAIDPYIMQIALGENTSKNLVTQMKTATGIQFEASYVLDENSFPIKGSYETIADGEMAEVFEMECL